ncbi:maleylpyruvate isomerase family mycothiol-dependent enzyme [Leekyejoonella antrihumi]|uniref:Maleylpyruvate isomerase family mycothiol-dependent enzyme n=1 Tax=Leekyejoonella antrihumi TaxID=1660198 RepID=A0A563DVM5_9MICO|nr:maleylpyruvate isomerase family mycothiol-dependent enzyme [Leekyejoonella antrihumi]TWP34031.1 maleylpyruvate isomerase family mycothiol-dependent enzyme [Leekyejoonella antrihumi]
MASRTSFIDHLRRDSERFAEVLLDAPADANVPTCPDWNSDDLLWHLAEVQWFWATIVTQDVRTTDQVHALTHPERPTTRGALIDSFERATAQLTEVLERTPGDQPRWMWTYGKDLHTVSYISRRQAHEALMHRIDAELTAGAPIAPIDQDLAADGLDEILAVMFAGAPDWVEFTANPGQVIQVVAEDTSDTWLAQIGRIAGKDPHSRESIDEASIRILESGSTTASATVAGAAADVDCWLWGRPTAAPLKSAGDESTLRAFGEIVAEGQQ